MDNLANEKDEKNDQASASPNGDKPESNDLNPSTVNFRPGAGFSVTCDLKAL